jgi:hypothetical protein
LKMSILQSLKLYNVSFLIFLQQMNKIQNSQMKYNLYLTLLKNQIKINQLSVDSLVSSNLINHPKIYMSLHYLNINQYQYDIIYI